jgi:hypothetical protein
VVVIYIQLKIVQKHGTDLLIEIIYIVHIVVLINTQSKDVRKHLKGAPIELGIQI